MTATSRAPGARLSCTTAARPSHATSCAAQRRTGSLKPLATPAHSTSVR